MPSFCHLQYVLQATKAGHGGLGTRLEYILQATKAGCGGLGSRLEYTVVSIIPRPFPHTNIGIGNGLGMRLHCGNI